jgi:hypothetical protein
MSNLSDKELDRLSREAADYYEPDHSSLSWSRLEQKLTEQMPERPPDGFRFGRINPYVWGSAVVLLAGLSYFFIKNADYSQHSTQTNPVAGVTKQKSSSGNVVTPENTVHLDSISSSGKDPATDRDAITRNNPAKSFSSGTNAGKEDLSDNRNSVSSGYSSANKNAGVTAGMQRNMKAASGIAGLTAIASMGSGSTVNDQGSITNVRKQATSDQGLVTGDLEHTNGAARTGAGLPMIASNGLASAHVKGNDSLLQHTALLNSPVPHKSLHLNRSLNIGLAFGPDYTDAGGISNNQLSNNIGITVGYYLTKKLSVNTGFFYSNKFFWGPGNDHNVVQAGTTVVPSSLQPSNYAFAAAPPVKFVNGSFNMYEMPLTLRYDFAANEKTKFFVNAGLSSYIVIKQTYIDYTHFGAWTQAAPHSDRQQINYWFDVADISFGMETNVGKGFSFQAEPFFRLPFRDMGEKNLKLNSYGVLLSFRYSPVLSKTKK